MVAIHAQKYNFNYQQFLSDINNEPDSLLAKHTAVLELARAGAAAFALSEYDRMGLDKVRNHEDIMALGGRLLKDQYLAHTGRKASEYALQSAKKYNAAFNETGGFFSGINAATMSFLGGAKQDIVEKQALRILEALPETSCTDPETRYYIEATRAEAYYLNGEIKESYETLRRAVDHDPLNYTAHTTTLKQFEMIAKKRGDQFIWTQEFRPPRAIHFAGHMFGVETAVRSKLPALEKAKIEELTLDIAETIQRQDIGYGYGALAAGADILIAEALLDEGCELHIVLPVPEEVFVKGSVAPYGEDWVKRFMACKNRAHSFQIYTNVTDWPNNEVDQYSSQIAMGLAILHRRRAVIAGQMLVWDEAEDNSGTARDAHDWLHTQSSFNRLQFVLPYPGRRRSRRKKPLSEFKKLGFAHAISETDMDARYDTLEVVCDAAVEARTKQIDCQQGLHVTFPDDENSDRRVAAKLSALALPGSIFVSEEFAALLALSEIDNYVTDFLGHSEDGLRLYALQIRNR